ncbi:MAG TPA: hypothetical protein VN637_18130 [Roseiarcus sp.]|nr:hypothetical protein [Roseiarcus sp.]
MTYPVLDAISGWRLAPDGPSPAGWWPQALMIVSMLDEITGLPPTVTPAASTTTSGVVARASEAQAGLVGSPLQLFLPGFITGAGLGLSLSGAGYLPVRLSQTFGAELGYPGAFAPIDLGVVSLHREPVTITGRTVSHGGAVRAGATVSLDGLWLTLADLANPPATPNLVSLASPLYADRDTTATIAAQPMTAGAAKTLLKPANAGDASVVLTDQVGLAVGAVIALDSDDPARAEYLAISGLAALGPGPAFPATASLALPLIRQHAAGASAIPQTLGAAGPANALAAAARAGDTALRPSAMTGLAAPQTPAVVSGSGAPAEFHLASPIAGTSGPDGYVRLPPAHRAAQLRLRAHHPAEPADLIRDVMLPLGVNALTLDFVFP